MSFTHIYNQTAKKWKMGQFVKMHGKKFDNLVTSSYLLPTWSTFMIQNLFKHLCTYHQSRKLWNCLKTDIFWSKKDNFVALIRHSQYLTLTRSHIMWLVHFHKHACIKTTAKCKEIKLYKMPLFGEKKLLFWRHLPLVVKHNASSWFYLVSSIYFMRSSVF